MGLIIQIAIGVALGVGLLELLFRNRTGRLALLFAVCYVVGVVACGLLAAGALLGYAFAFDNGVPDWLLWLAVACALALPIPFAVGVAIDEGRARDSEDLYQSSRVVFSREWWWTPNAKLGGVPPSDAAKTRKGLQRVRALLYNGE
jgi:hypothetical protein